MSARALGPNAIPAARSAPPNLIRFDTGIAALTLLVAASSVFMAQTSQLQTGLAVEAFGPAVAATAGAALIAVAIVGVNARDDEVRRFRDPRPVIDEPTDVAAS